MPAVVAFFSPPELVVVIFIFPAVFLIEGHFIRLIIQLIAMLARRIKAMIPRI